MSKRSVFLTILILIFRVEYAKSYSVADIQKIAKQEDVQSIEDLLGHLPTSLMESYTLQHTSSGLQEASFENPRVFLYENDGSFFATFNGSSDQSKFESIEVLEFSEEGNEFSLHEITFNQKGNLEIKKNPNECLACHANSRGKVHPIFEDYKSWPGFFGSFDDNIKARYKWNEKRALLHFNEKRNKHPRYRFLRDLPFHEDEDLSPFLRHKYKENDTYYGDRPNLRLMDLLFAKNSQRIVAYLKAHPKYEVVLPILAYFSLDTKRGSRSKLDFFQSENEYVEFVENLYNLFGKVPSASDSDLESLTLERRDFFQLMGLDDSDFSLSIGAGSPGDTFFFLGIVREAFYQPVFLNEEIMSDFFKSYPHIGNEARSFSMYNINKKYEEIADYDKLVIETLNSSGYFTQLRNVDFEKWNEVILSSVK